jgi:glycosyltransferase involved in cell wall biosynthesis
MKRVIVSVTNDLVTDNRVNRSCGVLKSFGFNVALVGRKLKHSGEINRPYRCKRFRMIFKKGFLFYSFYNLRLFFYLLFHRVDLLYSNDLDTLLPNYLVSKIKRIPLIYDSHELFTEVPELQNAPFKKAVWTKIEKYIVPNLCYCITVNDSIAKIFEAKYQVKFTSIRNVPEQIPVNVMGDVNLENIPTDAFTVIIQGSGLNIDRGLEEAIEAILLLENVQLLIVGGGDVIPTAKQMVKNLNLENKVHFYGKRPYNELMKFTAYANCGLAIDKATNKNHEFALPNKVFDYIQAGTPIICMDLKEISSIVLRYEIGIVIKDVLPSLIANAIRELQSNAPLLKIYKNNCEKAAKIEHWDNEKSKLEELINSIYPSSRQY